MNPDLQVSEDARGYEQLAAFDGEPADFWTGLCEYVRAELEVEAACLLLRAGGQEAEIRVLAQSPEGVARRLAQAGAVDGLRELQSPVFAPLGGPPGGRFAAMALPAGEGLPRLWMVLEGLAEERSATVVESVSKDVSSLADLYQARRKTRRSEEKLVTLSEVLDLGMALGETAHFNEAALRICNELAAPMRASRVSLAWMEGQDLKLKATSHGGRISANSEEARALEQVMEEAVDQDNEVAHPELADTSVISREHRQFSIAREGLAVLSVPLRYTEEGVGALCLERPAEEGAWESGEVERVRLLGDLVAPRLEDLHVKTGWIGKRTWRGLRRRATGWLGHEHTGWKLTVILLALTLLVLGLIPIDHKVKAPFILKTDAAALISAPFNGYIEAVHYHLGDLVKKDQAMVGLDRKELLLQLADTEAQRNGLERQIRKLEGEGALAEMRVAEAEMQQAEAKLAMLHHRLELTTVTAPFDGVVVEGDLRERLASPVETGELLLKIVQLEDLFGQLQIDDRDISYLQASQEGELAFTSRPEEKFPVRVDRFEPVAEIRPEGTVFLLRAHLLADAQDWWRPGMSGICKIEVGRRSILWIGVHRMIEALRLWLWI
jgi:hypothetical protein